MALTSTISNAVVKAEFTANSFKVNNQLAPDVLGLSGGGLVVAYNNHNIDKGLMRMDFFDADHNRIGLFESPYEGATKALGRPSLTELANGNVLVAWADQEAGDAGLRGRLFTPDGTPIGGELNLSPGVTAATEPQVAAEAGGGFAISFTSGTNVWCARFDEDGAPLGSNLPVNGYTQAGVQAQSTVAVLADGGIVVAYTDMNAAQPQIRANIFNANNTVRKADFIIGAVGANTEPKVAALDNGNWAVVYTDTGWSEAGSGSAGITLQIFSPSGANATPNLALHVNQNTALDEAEPGIAVLDNGYILVTWTHPILGGIMDIYGRVYTQEGIAVTEPFGITNSGSDADVKAAVSTLAGGKYIAAWQDGASGDDVGGEGSDTIGSQITAEVNGIVRTTVGDGADDSFFGDALRDIVNGGGGQDTLKGLGGDDTINGGAGADTLDGGGGDDTLDGGGGGDTMTGGLGGDRFFVRSAGDKIIELAGQGSDWAYAAVNYTLTAGAHVENLSTTSHAGTADIKLTGNALAQTITGNDGNNWLDSFTGAADTLAGRSGSDSYLVRNAGDAIVELAGQGSDWVYAAVSYALTAGAEVENLSTTSHVGTAAINLTGNALGQAVWGNDGANVLNGGAGNDTLNGRGGADVFLFNTALNAATNVDTIVSYNVADDTIRLDNAVFTGLVDGALAAGAFRIGAAAADADDRIVYNSATGALIFDANGNAAGGATQFATLSPGLAMTAAEFFVV